MVKSLLIVFFGTALANFLQLLYQLLLAHWLLPADFAAFNALLSIFVVVSIPLTTMQTVITKYAAEFNAQGQIQKIKGLLSGLLRVNLLLAVLTLLIFYFAASWLAIKLKIDSLSSVYILSLMLAISWITPLFSGGLQGLELFKWMMSVAILTGGFKLLLTFIFLIGGYGIAGALAGLLFSLILGLLISFFPLKHLITFTKVTENINFKEMLLYLFPIAISYLCFMSMVNIDMVLVKYYFAAEAAGVYSLAQMVGKIFLFLPGAISIVIFPKVCGLNVKNLDTRKTIKRSLFYALILCLAATLFYNLFPVFTLKILTGKSPAESVILGRLFSISMSFFALIFIFITYFLSVNDLRFIKYLVIFSGLQFLAICLFHRTLLEVQVILCISSASLLIIYLLKGLSPSALKGLSPKGTVPDF